MRGTGEKKVPQLTVRTEKTRLATYLFWKIKSSWKAYRKVNAVTQFFSIPFLSKRSLQNPRMAGICNK